MSQQFTSKVQGSIQQIPDEYPLKGIRAGWFNTALGYLQNPVKSYIYFIVAMNENFEPLVKVGLTIDMDRRIKEIMTDLESAKYQIDWLELGAASIQLLGMVEGTQPLETALHKAFHDYQAGREWFWYTEDLEMMIDDLLDQYCACTRCVLADNYVTQITLT